MSQDLLEAIKACEKETGRDLDHDLLSRAHEYSLHKHGGQKRRSGEDHIRHCIEVAKISMKMGLDSVSIAAALLHDVVEDTKDTTVDDIRTEFGSEIATIVGGLTKISKFALSSKEKRQVETYRKLLLSAAQDARVIYVKLADRLHNMCTLEHMPEEARHRIALETREIYAPLAHRFGVARIKWELEDLAFKFLEPEDYQRLVREVGSTRREREGLIQEMEKDLRKALKAADIKCKVTGRPKHLWSIHCKLNRQREETDRERKYEDVHDALAMRIIVDNRQKHRADPVRACYTALGVVHNKWPPRWRPDDFIAAPKSNLYQSLHTTVFGPGDAQYEIQIRTQEMHHTAEYGLATHWRYKDRSGDEADVHLEWFRHLVEWQQGTLEPEEFMGSLRINLFQDEIFVFTPAGDLKRLPKGATPIDFAFAVHTEVGLHCSKAKVNDRIAPLSRPLRSGDRVHILTSDAQTPSRDWLGFVRSGKARHEIRQWVRREEEASARALGRQIVQHEWRRHRRGNVGETALRQACETLGYDTPDALYVATGRGDVGLTDVRRALLPEVIPDVPEKTPSPPNKLLDKVWGGGGKGIRIRGRENVMYQFSQCCQPLPGDKVVGYRTRERVSIHRQDCPNVLSLSKSPESRVEIGELEADGQRLVRIIMEGTDRHGLFADIARAVSDTGTNIQSADIEGIEGGMRGQFAVEVEDLRHLLKVMRQVLGVKGVLAVERKESFGESDSKLE